MFSGLETPYDLVVTGGQVNRAEWAKVVQELIDIHTKGKKEPFARLVGVNARTIHSWLGQSMTVSEQSVRQVATACGLSAIDLLIRVGVYTREEMPAPEVPPEDAWIVEVIQSSNVLDQDKKDRLIAIELERARREREEKKRLIDEQIELIAGPET